MLKFFFGVGNGQICDLITGSTEALKSPQMQIPLSFLCTITIKAPIHSVLWELTLLLLLGTVRFLLLSLLMQNGVVGTYRIMVLHPARPKQ